tara:strand:+ start:2535 stop:3680 length:1146 start_codon:yes stop_codon:yes gene_type:complete
MLQFSDRLKNLKEYYFSVKLREVNKLIKSGQNIINMAIGNPDISPHKNVKKALSDSLKFDKSHMYQSYQGIPELRSSISIYYERKYNVILEKNSEILPLMGSKEGIIHISLAFLNKGDRVLIPNPGYPTYLSATKMVEAKPVFYDLEENNKWYPNIEKLKSLNLKGIKIMWINYPNMPTGSNFDNKKLSEIVKFTKEQNIILINDNPYSLILNNNPKSIFNVRNSFESCLELNSLSKSHNIPGWRVGMVIGSKDKIEKILKVKSNMDSGMFYGIQKGAVEALNLPDLWFNNLNKEYEKRKKLVLKFCDILDLKVQSGSVGMFVWAKILNNQNSYNYIDDLLTKHKIFITPGTIFGSVGEGYVRISLCVSIAKIKEAINRII